MPLSKVIKANQKAEVLTFDFREICDGMGALLHQAPSQPGEVEGSQGQAEPQPVEDPPEQPEPPQPPEPEIPQPDPLKDLEETIQKRLFEAEQKAKAIEKEAYEKGYAQGVKDGTEYGRKNMAGTKEHLEQVLAGLKKLPEKIFSDYRQWFVSTCMALAKQIIRRVVEAYPECLLDTIERLVGEAEDSSSLSVYLNPKDLELLEQYADLKKITEHAERSFTLKPDPKLERGGCVVESEIQLVDATIAMQLARLEEAFLREGAVPEDVPA